jgi:hypothetical protein
MSEKARIAFARLMRRLSPKDQRALLAFVRASNDDALLAAKPRAKSAAKKQSPRLSAAETVLENVFAGVEARAQDKLDLLLEALEAAHGPITLTAKGWRASVRALEKRFGEAALCEAARRMEKKVAAFARGRDAIT